MPQYYLSYIEINGHAALMLSQQDQTSGPARIICELGFAYSPAVKESEVHFYTRHKGHVREEMNASRALYGHANVKHKTYELSQAEVNQFFNIVNRDKNQNSSPVVITSEEDQDEQNPMELVGGPDYQLLKFNCKSYATGVLREMGIQDSTNLRSYLVQVPGSNNSQLEDISPDDLACPDKDRFINKLDPLLNRAADVLYELLENSDNIGIKAKPKKASLEELLFDEKTEISQETFVDSIMEGIALAKQLGDNLHKAGFDVDFEKNYEKFQTLISNICGIENDARVKTINGLKKAKFDEIIEALDEVDLDLGELEEDYETIDIGYSDNSLEFFWKTSPPLTKRLDFQNFSMIEKMIYLKKIQAQEIEDNLNQVRVYLDDKLCQLGPSDQEYASDLIYLRNAINEHKDRISASKVQFLGSLDKLDNKTKVQACIEQERHEREILSGLKDKISLYQPQSEKKVNGFMRLINRILQFFLKDYFGPGNSINNWLNKRLNGVKPRSHYYNKEHLFSHPESSQNSETRPANGVVVKP